MIGITICVLLAVVVALSFDASLQKSKVKYLKSMVEFYVESIETDVEFFRVHKNAELTDKCIMENCEHIKRLIK